MCAGNKETSRGQDGNSGDAGARSDSTSLLSLKVRVLERGLDDDVNDGDSTGEDQFVYTTLARLAKGALLFFALSATSGCLLGMPKQKSSR